MTGCGTRDGGRIGGGRGRGSAGPPRYGTSSKTGTSMSFSLVPARKV